MSEILNLKITAIMASPLSGGAPAFDALLMYILSFKSNNIISRKWSRSTPIEEFDRLPIPITEIDINGIKVNSCSDPILSYKIAEWNDNLTNRFETDKQSLLVNDKYRKTILVGGGPLKRVKKQMRVRAIDKITWFVRGNPEKIRELLNESVCIGYNRKIGYGIVSEWLIEKDNAENKCIFAKMGNKKILMKTIPLGGDLKNIGGYRIGYGACTPPYWHPQNFQEIAIPC